MKLIHILFVGAAALLGVVAATCPADYLLREAVKESQVRALFLDGVTMKHYAGVTA